MAIEFFVNLASDIHAIRITSIRDDKIEQEKMKTIVLRAFGSLAMLLGAYAVYAVFKRKFTVPHLVPALFFLIEGFDFAIIGRNKASAIARLNSSEIIKKAINVQNSAYLYRGTLVANNIFQLLKSRAII